MVTISITTQQYEVPQIFLGRSASSLEKKYNMIFKWARKPFLLYLALVVLAPPERCQDAFPLKQVKGSATVPQSAPASQAG